MGTIPVHPHMFEATKWRKESKYLIFIPHLTIGLFFYKMLNINIILVGEASVGWGNCDVDKPSIDAPTHFWFLILLLFYLMNINTFHDLFGRKLRLAVTAVLSQPHTVPTRSSRSRRTPTSHVVGRGQSESALTRASVPFHLYLHLHRSLHSHISRNVRFTISAASQSQSIVSIIESLPQKTPKSITWSCLHQPCSRSLVASSSSSPSVTLRCISRSSLLVSAP